MPKPKTVKELVYQLSEEPGFTDLTDDEQYSIIDRASSELGLKATSPEPPTKHPVEQAFESEQQAKAMAAQQQQAAIAQQQQVDRDPKNWSPERLDAEIKANPPKTMQEAASVEMLRLQKENEIEMLKTQDKQAKEQAASAQKAQAALQKVTQTHFVQQSKSLLKDLLKGIEAPIAGMPQQVGSLIKEQGTAIKEPLLNPSAPKDLMEETNWPDPGDLVKLFRASIKKTGAGQKLEDYGQKLIDDNKKYLEQHAAQYTPEQNALNQFVYQFGSGTTSIAAAIGLSLATRSPAAASIAFGAYQKAQVYQEATEAGEAPEQARTRSNMAGIVEGALESVGLKWFFGAKAFRRVSPHVVRSAIEAGQEIAQQSGEEAIMSDIRKSGFADVSKRIALAGSIGGLLGGGSSAVLSTVQQQGLVKRLEALGFSKDVSEKIAKAEIDAALREENGQLQKLVESGEIDKSIDTLQPVSQELTTPESTKKPIYPQEQEAVSAPKAEVPIVQREQEPAAAPEAGPAQVPSAPQAETVQPQSLPGEVPPPPIAYEDFKKEYVSNFNSLMKYRPDQVGSQVFAEKMAKMSDEHPDWVERIENEGAVSAPTEAVQAAPPAQPAEVVQEQPKPIEPIQEQQKEAIVSELQLPTDPFLLRARAAKVRADFKVADEKLRTVAKSNESLLKLYEQLVEQGRSTRSVEERLAVGIQKLEDAANRWKVLDQERAAIVQRMPSVTREKLLASEGTMKLEEVQKIAERARAIGAKQAEKVARAEQRTALREEREKAAVTLRESKKALREEKQEAVVSEREKQTVLRREALERHIEKSRQRMEEHRQAAIAAREDIKQKWSDEKRSVASVKHSIRKYAQLTLPRNVPSALLKTVETAKSYRALEKALRQIDRYNIKFQRAELTRQIKFRLRQVRESENMDARIQKKIIDAMDNIDFVKHTEETLEKASRRLEWVNRMALEGQDINVNDRFLDSLAILEKRSASSFSLSELQGIHDKLVADIKIARLKLRTRKAIDKLLNDQTIKDVQEGIVNNDKFLNVPRQPGETATVGDALRNMLAKSGRLSQKLDLGLVPMNTVLDMMDKVKGYMGVMFRQFKNKIDYNDDVYLDRRDDLWSRVTAYIKEHNVTKQMSERIGVHAIKNMEGGMEYLANAGVTKETIDKIKLNDVELGLYNLMREELDAIRPAIDQQTYLIFNKVLGKVRNYFPLVRDWQKTNESLLIPLGGEDVQRLQKYPEHGFTKERVGGLENVELDAVKVFLRHMDDAAYFLTYTQDLKRMWDVVHSPEFAQAAGKVNTELITGWLDTLARHGGSSSKPIPLLDFLRKNTNVGVLGFKLSTILIQYTQLIDGAALVGGKWVFPAFSDIVSSQELRNWMRDNFPQLRERAGDDIAMMEFSNNPTFSRVQKASLKPTVVSDWLAASSVALASYKKNLAAKGQKFDMSKIDKEAVLAAERDMARAQASQRPKDMSPSQGQGYLTHNRSLDRALTQFQSFIQSKWARIRYDLPNLWITDKAELARQASWIALSTIAESGIRVAFSRKVLAAAILSMLGLLDWDKVEEEYDEASKGFPNRVLMDLLGTVPVMGPVISTAVYESQAIPGFEGGADFFAGIAQTFTRKTKRAKLRSAIKATGGAGQLLGVPLNQIQQFLVSVLDVLKNEKSSKKGSRLRGTKLRGKR